jgi:hypothetical protein
MPSSPILGKYDALDRLGAGAHGNHLLLTCFVDFLTVETVVLGRVVRAADVKGVSVFSAQYAIKLERASKKRPRPPSEHEVNVLQILADANVSPRIPRVIDHGYDKPSHSNALVLDLLGADLQYMRKQCRGQFSIQTTMRLALELVRVPDFCAVSL